MTDQRLVVTINSSQLGSVHWFPESLCICSFTCLREIYSEPTDLKVFKIAASVYVRLKVS